MAIMSLLPNCQQGLLVYQLEQSIILYYLILNSDDFEEVKYDIYKALVSTCVQHAQWVVA